MPQLTTLIRQKYPEYKDMSDEDLEKAVLEKHPEYSDLVKDQPSEISATISSNDVPEKIEPEIEGVNVNPLTKESAKYDINKPEPIEDNPSLISKIWRQQTTPLTDVPEKLANKVSEFIDPEHGTTGPAAYSSAFIEGIGKAISGLTTPLNLETLGASSGAALAGKAGLETIANLLSQTSRGLSVPVAAEGGKNVVTGETWPDKLSGALELAGGLFGMRGHIPDIAESSTAPKAAMSEEIPLQVQPQTDLPNPVQSLPPDFTPVGSEGEFNAVRQGDIPPSPEEVIFKNASEKQGMGLPSPNETVSSVSKLSSALDQAAPLEKEQAEIYSKERSERLGKASGVLTPGEAGYFEQLSKLKGEHTKVTFEPLRTKLEQPDIDNLYDTITNHPSLSEYAKISTKDGLTKILNGSVPQAGQIESLGKVFGEDFTNKFEKFYPENKTGKLQQAYDLPRGMMSVDPPFMTSAAFRQASPFVGTKAWFKAWGTAAKSYGSKAVSDKIMEDIQKRPLFKSFVDETTGEEIPSYAKQVGLKMGDLSKYSKRDEAIRGELAERIPIYGKAVAASNRAFNAFLNSVAADTFDNLFDDAVKQGLNPRKNQALGQEIAEFINTSLRRGKLGIEAGSHQINLEKHARALSNTFFSPRTISSTIRILNPSTYVMAQPFVRRQYLTAMIRQVGTWWTLAGLAELGGASVSKDPNSADFGKIKIGNMRVDVPSGLQQYLVLGHRNLPEKLGGGGITSTTSERFTPFGKGYKPETRFSTVMQFGINRLHPTAKIVTDLLSATEKQPFHTGDRILQLAAPMFSDDLMNIARDNPDLAPLILGAAVSGAGMGTQSYERGSFGKPTFIPEEYDLNIGAK